MNRLNKWRQKAWSTMLINWPQKKTRQLGISPSSRFFNFDPEEAIHAEGKVRTPDEIKHWNRKLAEARKIDDEQQAQAD